MPIFETMVYLLCLTTSAACAYLLIRSYGRAGSKLLLWSSACFVLLAVNNTLVVVDLLLLPQIDLLPLRHAVALIAVGTLVYGFVWEID